MQLVRVSDCSLQQGKDAAIVARLLTASNDGTVCLWDLGRCCNGKPLEVAQATNLHAGEVAAHLSLAFLHLLVCYAYDHDCMVPGTAVKGTACIAVHESCQNISMM